MPKAVFYDELRQGKRDRGAPRKRFKDQLKQQLSAASIPEKDWENIASDRDSWRATTKRGAGSFESARRGSRGETQVKESARSPEPSCSRFPLSSVRQNVPVTDRLTQPLEGVPLEPPSLHFPFVTTNTIIFSPNKAAHQQFSVI